MELAEPYMPPEESLSDRDKSDNLELIPKPKLVPEKDPANKNGTPKEELTVKEGDFVKQAMEKMPEAVLPHVLNAAEQNKPLEAVYERRHEIKDESGQSPVPISSVISDRPKTVLQTQKEEPGVSSVFVPFDPARITPEELNAKTISNIGYKKAIRLGFTGGIIIVIGFLIILITR